MYSNQETYWISPWPINVEASEQLQKHQDPKNVTLICDNKSVKLNKLEEEKLLKTHEETKPNLKHLPTLLQDDPEKTYESVQALVEAMTGEIKQEEEKVQEDEEERQEKEEMPNSKRQNPTPRCPHSRGRR